MDNTTSTSGSLGRLALLAGAAVFAAVGIVYAVQSPTAGTPSQEVVTLQAPTPALNETRPEPDASAERDGTVYMYE